MKKTTIDTKEQNSGDLIPVRDDNMATSTERSIMFTAELNKLKKETLISINVSKGVPSGVLLSRDLKMHIEQSVNTDDNEYFRDSVDVAEDSLNSATNINVVKLCSDLKVAKTQVECLQKINNNLEVIINDKNITTNISNTVAGSTENSLTATVNERRINVNERKGLW